MSDPSLCDVCTHPGYCCFNLSLNLSLEWQVETQTPLEVMCALQELPQETVLGQEIPLPFLPLWKLPNGRWNYWCPLLTKDGKCGDYENRPKLCEMFQPGSDPLCVMSACQARQHGD